MRIFHYPRLSWGLLLKHPLVWHKLWWQGRREAMRDSWRLFKRIFSN